MKYNDSILENKAFDIFKQLLYYIVLSICIVLAGCLLMVYGFRFRPYNILTGSMTPVYCVGDLVVVKAEKEYKVGDVLKFSQSANLPTVHRLLAIKKIEGNTYYLCHGDAVQAVDGSDSTKYTWQEQADIIKNIDMSNMTYKEATSKVVNVQFVRSSEIEGRVITSLKQWGAKLTFISEHKLLFIAMVIALWCVTSSIQNELDVRKARRLL